MQFSYPKATKSVYQIRLPQSRKLTWFSNSRLVFSWKSRINRNTDHTYFSNRVTFEHHFFYIWHENIVFEVCVVTQWPGGRLLRGGYIWWITNGMKWDYGSFRWQVWEMECLLVVDCVPWNLILPCEILELSVWCWLHNILHLQLNFEQ